MSLESRLVNLAAVGHKLVERGLVLGTGGDLSLRWEDVCYITPANARLDRLAAADFVPLHVDKPNSWQVQRASGEHALHLACYRTRSDAATLFHVHPPNCIALGCAGLSIPAVTPDFYHTIGAAVPLLPYLSPRSDALASAVSERIATHDAVLLRNNGLVLVAPSTDEAYLRCAMIEEAARIVLLALAATGTCSALTEVEMQELDRLAGQPRRHAPQSS